MKSIISLLTLLLVSSAMPNLKDLHFLAGTWKVEKKETYESWKLDKDNLLEGSSYKIKGGNKQIDEQLHIKMSAEKIVYTAKVLNQNNAQPIDFVLNKEVKDKFSFENPKHDFPKKIQYTKLNDTTLFVAVLGDGDKGFSYKMFKQK
jgi:hypothetical protein